MSAPFSFTHPTILILIERLKLGPATLPQLCYCIRICDRGARQACDWLISLGLAEQAGRTRLNYMIYQLTLAGYL